MRRIHYGGVSGSGQVAKISLQDLEVKI